MPSKALLRPLVALADARAVAGAREAAVGTLDAGAVLERRDDFASHWSDKYQVQWLRENGIELVRGHARIARPRIVEVGTGTAARTLAAEHAVVICTGSRPAIPDVPGLREARPWTSREATSAHAVPESLIVIGGGPVGCELATAWRALGADVAMFLRADRPLDRLEPFAGAIVLDALRELGVHVETNVALSRIERSSDGAIAVTLDDGRTRTAREVLVATGREPRTDDLGLEVLGIEPGDWLTVDDHMQVRAVTGGWLYAAGDVTHRALLTHMGKYEARICGDVIAARVKRATPPSASTETRAIPRVVFTDPEVASVGITEAQAREQGVDVQVIDHDLDVAGAKLYADHYRGSARLVVDAERKVIVGATFVGKGVAELLHSATIAIVGEVPLDRLVHAVPSFPTISEIWLRLLETAGY